MNRSNRQCQRSGTGRDSHGPPPPTIASNSEGLTLRSPVRGTSLTFDNVMITAFTFAAFVVTVLYYAVRASEVRLDSSAVRKRKRWVSGVGAFVLGPVVALLAREPGIDRGMLGFLTGLLVVCAVMFASSFLGTPQKEKERA